MIKKALMTTLLSLVLVTMAACDQEKKQVGEESSEATIESTQQLSTSSETTVSSTSTQPVITAMNLDEIRTGNYASINGTWQNGFGKTITVSGDTMNFSDITNHEAPATLKGKTLDIPSENAEDGTPKMVAYLGSTQLPAYEKEMTPDDHGSYYSLGSRLPGAAVYVSFIPKGEVAELMNAIADQDKLLALGTQNTPTSAPAEYVYYRVDH